MVFYPGERLGIAAFTHVLIKNEGRITGTVFNKAATKPLLVGVKIVVAVFSVKKCPQRPCAWRPKPLQTK
jgi:hypothetical protein